MTDREYEELRQQIEDDYTANLVALERVYAFAKKLPKRKVCAKESANGAPIVSDEAPLERDEAQDQEEPPNGAVLRAVRTTIENMSGSFGWSEVAEKLRRDRPEREWQDTIIRQAVRDLAEIGELDIAEQGVGRRYKNSQRP